MFRRIRALVVLGVALGAACGVAPRAAPPPPEADPHDPAPMPPSDASLSATGDDACASVAELATCVHEGIGTLQGEPERGALPAFVRAAREHGVTACADVTTDGVQWSREELGTSHFDDATMAYHLEYRFERTGCAPATFTIDLELGTPTP